MDSISNIQTFEKNVPPRAVVDNRLTSLLGFAAVPKAIRTILSLSVLSYPITGNNLDGNTMFFLISIKSILLKFYLIGIYKNST